MLRKGLVKLVLILLFFIVSAAIALGLLYLVFEIEHVNRIYPGVYVGGINIEGKTSAEAKDIINKQLIIINQEGIAFYHDNNKSIVYPIVSSPDATIADVLIDFKVDDTINKAMAVGRSGNLIIDTKDKLGSFLNNNHYLDLSFNFDDNKIKNILKEDFSVFEPENASFYFDSDNNLLVKEGRAGKTINYEKGLKNLRNNLGRFNFSNIVLTSIDSNPEISGSDCLTVRDGVGSFLEIAPVKLKYGKKEWSIDKPILLEWIVLSKNNNGLSIILNKDKIRSYLENKVATQIDQDPTIPKFTLNDGKIENFQPGKQGLKLDIDSTVNVLASLLNNPLSELDLPVKELSAPSNPKENNGDLGIKEIIGKYSLKFDGSTNARIANIKNGAKSLNGLLIKPNGEFSTLNALGTIDAIHGYVKEAIIKGNAISYDFGGGLCHLSTTLFRSVLSAGLPITMRQNHSYDMPYYEPAGVDATIYDPSPDFKFVNDTNNYILIQAEVINGALVIELWGTKDGRTINRTEPVIYNIVRPMPTKIVGTYTLAKGQKKCTYAAYNGSDTYFDYEVTYSNGTVKKERFGSHYIPRQGVCLVGI